MSYLFQQRRRLAVIGAGPKGLAVAVKAKVLAEFGLPAAQVTLIERYEIAAHWSGDFGYTDGDMTLGTSPEKDVVFPIETKVGDDELDQQIQRRLLDFTWMAFLVRQGRYSDWVDRGRPAPCHQGWAKYLQWVYKQLEGEITFVRGEVVTLEQEGRQWLVKYREPNCPPIFQDLVFDEVMITGPGKLRDEFLPQGLPIQAPIFDIESFWAALKSKQFSDAGTLAIVGAGENAASILLALGKCAPDLSIEIISPKGFLATRAENFYENQIYSQPERNGWQNLEEEDRRDFMSRTDLGVFSEHAMKILNEQKQHRVIPGRVTLMQPYSKEVQVTTIYAGKSSVRSYNQVILATGFDQASGLLALLGKSTQRRWERQLGKKITSELLASKILPDLSLGQLSAPLYVPMLAGLSQGPGFANLSCLGRLSDRVVLSPLLAQLARKPKTLSIFRTAEV